MARSKITPRRILSAWFCTLLMLTAFNLHGDETSNVLSTNVKVFDDINDGLIAKDILFEHNLIKQMGRDSEAPATATVINGLGHTLMPGQIESHVHLNFQPIAES